ncbi:MAG: hypothetical protein EP330_21975 [Deltaproteobacteria bacterium]|nr:MAG: hypothetical protein EP330_21975 [Deltaproteobacteria bacterium]
MRGPACRGDGFVNRVLPLVGAGVLIGGLLVWLVLAPGTAPVAEPAAPMPVAGHEASHALKTTPVAFDGEVASVAWNVSGRTLGASVRVDGGARFQWTTLGSDRVRTLQSPPGATLSAVAWHPIDFLVLGIDGELSFAQLPGDAAVGLFGKGAVEGRVSDPKVSAEHTFVVFVSATDTGHLLYAWDPNRAATPELLLRTGSTLAQPAVSPDESVFVFVKDGELWRLPVGGEPALLHGGATASGPAFVRGGEALVFLRQDVDDSWDLCELSVAGGEARCFAEDVRRPADQIGVSAAGDWVAYTRPDQREILLWNLLEEREVAIPVSEASPHSPVLVRSGDETRLAYVAEVEGRATALYADVRPLLTP